MGQIRDLLNYIGPWEAASRRREIRRFARPQAQWQAGVSDLAATYYGSQLVVADCTEWLHPGVRLSACAADARLAQTWLRHIGTCADRI
jgi:hypothetical protein